MRRIDLVYPVSSRARERLLHYSLRTVARFGLGVGKIYLVGGAEWRRWESEKIKLVHFPDFFGNWYLNTALKVWVATLVEGISDPFLFMNDDFFLTRPVYLPEFPVYHEGDLAEKLKNPFHDARYKAAIRRTIAILKRAGSTTFSYELHYPLPIYKETFRAAMEEVKEFWAVPRLRDGVLWRSLYGNLAGLGGTPWEDGKIYRGHKVRTVRRLLRSHPVVSSEPKPHPELLRFLRRLFPGEGRRAEPRPRPSDDVVQRFFEN